MNATDLMWEACKECIEQNREACRCQDQRPVCWLSDYDVEYQRTGKPPEAAQPAYEARGFYMTGTGGGCTAYRKDLDYAGVYVLVTTDDGGCAPAYACERVLTGVYADDGATLAVVTAPNCAGIQLDLLKDIAAAQAALNLYPDASPYWDSSRGQETMRIETAYDLKATNTNGDRCRIHGALMRAARSIR
jgi:hypothetical protein